MSQTQSRAGAPSRTASVAVQPRCHYFIWSDLYQERGLYLIEQLYRHLQGLQIDIVASPFRPSQRKQLTNPDRVFTRMWTRPDTVSTRKRDVESTAFCGFVDCILCFWGDFTCDLAYWLVTQISFSRVLCETESLRSELNIFSCEMAGWAPGRVERAKITPRDSRTRLAPRRLSFRFLRF